MKKTISLIASLLLFCSYCLAYDNTDTSSDYDQTFLQEELMIHAIDCSEWIESIPPAIEPMHIDPTEQLDLQLEQMEWDNENFHFNYLLHPCSDEACFRQASLRFRQQMGHDFGYYPYTSLCDLYTWLWICKASRL